MIPKPPFPKDLSPEQEAAEFEALKPRLGEVWDALTMRDEVPHTSVIVPSLTLDQSELTKIAEVAWRGRPGGTWDGQQFVLTRNWGSVATLDLTNPSAPRIVTQRQ